MSIKFPITRLVYNIRLWCVSCVLCPDYSSGSVMRLSRGACKQRSPLARVSLFQVSSCRQDCLSIETMSMFAASQDHMSRTPTLSSSGLRQEGADKEERHYKSIVSRCRPKCREDRASIRITSMSSQVETVYYAPRTQ